MHELNLFGTPLEPPRPRAKASVTLGTTQLVDQNVLAAPTPPSLLHAEPRRENDDTPDDEDLPAPDLSARQILKRYLQQNSIAFVDADKVKGGLFSRDRLELFDFVVHREDASYLVAACAKRPHTSLLADLKQWEGILGPGFQAAVAIVDEDDPICFRTIDGDRVDIA